jgi:hypothetical protein
LPAANAVTTSAATIVRRMKTFNAIPFLLTCGLRPLSSNDPRLRRPRDPTA